MSDVGARPLGEPRRLHPLSPVLDLAKILPQLVVLLVVGGAGGLFRLPILAVGALLLLGVRYLAWARTSYRIEDGALVVEKGLLDRTRTVLPVDRVQQVDLQRKVRHQLTGLVVVRIDRAGGGDRAEVVLDALTVADAAELRAALGEPGRGAGTAPVAPTADGEASPAGSVDHVVHPVGPLVGPPEDERELVALGLKEVALAGVTGARLLVVFAAAGALMGVADDVFGEDVYGTVAEQASDGVRSGPLAVAVVALLAVPLWLAVGAGASILADGGFRLTRRGDRLRVTRGVLDQREASLAIHRIQVVRLRDNPMRRALGRVSVTLQSAGGAGNVEGAKTTITVPLLRAAQVDALLAEVLPAAPSLPDLPPAPAAARRRAWTRRILPALVVTAALTVLDPWGLGALVLVVLAGGLGELAYRGLGWATLDGHVVTRQGGLARETALVPVAKAQSTRLRSSPLQRRAGLATLLVDVAGRGSTPAIVDGDGSALARLRYEALATTAARRDEAAVRRHART